MSDADEPAFRLDGYGDLTEIGRGGSSTVYRAWQADLNRWVAIKVVRIAGDGASLSQFNRERLAVGTLSGHPNIVTVHDAGITDQRTAFIVMELLPDGTLGDRLGQGPLAWSEAAVVGVKLSGALESAHRLGVLHLDVKPDNVFLAHAYDSVKLGDFGIARIEGKPETRSGTIAGTLLHMPPERLQDGTATAASDVYSLGSTLFTAVFGASPFGDGREAAGVVVGRILGGRRVRPSLPAPPMSASFLSVVEQALAADPRSRQASAGELGEQLRRAQAEAGSAPTPMLVSATRAVGPVPIRSESRASPQGEDTAPPEPTPPPFEEGPPEHPSRRPVWLALVTAVIVALVAGAVAARVGPFRQSPTSTSAGPSTTVALTPNTVPVRPAGGTVPVVTDDFSDPSTGWTDVADDAHYDGEGAYRIHLKSDHTRRAAGPRDGDPAVSALAAPGVNIRVAVDARVLSSTVVGAGVFCRWEAERYQGVVFSTGRWQITRDRTGTSTVLTSGETTLAGDLGRVELECSDDGTSTRLTLRVGGEPLGTWVDPDGLRVGTMGVVAATANASSGDVVFDNFLAAPL